MFGIEQRRMESQRQAAAAAAELAAAAAAAESFYHQALHAVPPLLTSSPAIARALALARRFDRCWGIDAILNTNF